ncbi:TVP38/TMEM64 family protein [Patescibacteria group bacterium]
MSAIINFYISRFLGRKWVIKLAGKDSIKRIDQLTDIMGEKLLIFARLFGFPLYEFVSYAVGFTNMSFKRYFLITATLSVIPGTLLTIWMYYSLASPLSLSVFLVTVVLIGALFSWWSVRFYLRKNTKV